jgi:hypothetical protein
MWYSRKHFPFRFNGIYYSTVTSIGIVHHKFLRGASILGPHLAVCRLTAALVIY